MATLKTAKMIGIEMMTSLLLRADDAVERLAMSGHVQGFRVRVCGCRHDGATRARRRPASEKRQGTKSREVGHRRCRGRYGDLAGASGWARLGQRSRRKALRPCTR